MTLEEAMVEVWRQALVEGAESGEKGKVETRKQKLESGEDKNGPRSVELGGERFVVRETPRKRLREVDFVFEGQRMRGFGHDRKREYSAGGAPIGRLAFPALQDQGRARCSGWCAEFAILRPYKTEERPG